MSSMQRVFGLAFLLSVGMYLGAQLTLAKVPRDGIVHMRWATDDNPARKVQVALFHRMYPHDAVTVDPGLGGDQTKLIVQCATGTGPDIVDVYGETQMTQLVGAGVLLDLTPYAKQMGFDPSRTYPAIVPGLEVDGKQYRFPCNVWANCVIYNKQIFDDHGVAYPRPDWTYADFVRTAEQLRDNPSRTGQTTIPVANWNNVGFYEDLLIGQGGRFFSPDGLRSALASPQSIAALQFYHDMMYRYRVIPTAAETAALTSQGGWGSAGLDWFSSGRAAMIIIGRWYIVQMPNYPRLKGHLGAALLPHFPGRPSSGITDTRAAGINVKSKHWREALHFLEYLASPQYGQVIVDDGDALPPNPDVARTGKQLVNADVPDPAFHEPFVEAMRTAHTIDVSPFIDDSVLDRDLSDAIQRVENNLQTPQEALQSLADQIDQIIRRNLERRPDLQRLYVRGTSRPYRPDWWRAGQEHGT